VKRRLTKGTKGTKGAQRRESKRFTVEHAETAERRGEKRRPIKDCSTDYADRREKDFRSLNLRKSA
jgi:hypothetical protein